MYNSVSLSIGLQYVDDDAGSWSLRDLGLNRGVINPLHLDLAGFETAVGGLRLYDRRIFCFLNTDGLTDLFSSAWFLLESVAALRAAADEEAHAPAPMRPADAERTVASLHHEDGSRLHLSAVGPDLCLSFLDDKGHCPTERHSPYFADFSISRSVWIQAAIEAVDEYAQIVRRLAGPNIDTHTGPGRILAMRTQ